MWRSLIVVVAFSCAFANAIADEAITFEIEELVIETQNGAHKLKVEMARTDNQLRHGLMYRRTLASDSGMLFDYRIEQPAKALGMWMKNTFIPLDMLFIDAKGRVVQIAENATPHSETIILAENPTRAVLELTAGTVARLGIEVGDRVIHDLFAGDEESYLRPGTRGGKARISLSGAAAFSTS